MGIGGRLFVGGGMEREGGWTKVVLGDVSRRAGFGAAFGM